ncbi:MAG: hypothetical protein F9K30_14360, partial [Dechloromonas sp.]
MQSISFIGAASALSRFSAAQRLLPNTTAAAATLPTGEKVTVSAEARAAQAAESAAKSAGIPLPQAVRDWFAKDFPEDVLNEAAARLAAIRESGRLGAEGPLGLPLLPESQALLDSFRAEMQTLSAA